MSFKLGFYTKNTLCLITVLFLFSIPIFCQSTKPKLVEQTKAKSQSTPLTLTPDNLKKEAYKMWFHWYKAKQQGKVYPQPTLDIPNYLDAKEANKVRMAWQQAQQQAQRDIQQFQGNVIKRMDMASAYKIWAEWYLGQHQGKNVAMPNLVVRNVDQKEAKRIQAIWQQAQIKAQNDIKNQLANNKKPQLTQVNNSFENVQTVSSVQANSPSNSMVSPTPNTRLFAGQEYDADLGLYYNRSRYLKTSSGRFITQDSFEGSIFQPQSLHKYNYAHNNPTNNLDPTGQSITTIAAAFNYALPLTTISARPIGSFFTQNDAAAFVGNDMKSVNEALTEAKNITTKNTRCDLALFETRYLGTPSPNVYSLNTLVSQLNPLTNLFDGRNSTYIPLVAGNPNKLSIKEIFKKNPQAAAVTTLYNNRSAIFINKPFFDFVDLPKFARSTILLHESVHAFGNLEDTDFGKTLEEGSFFLNTRIASECYPGIMANDSLRTRLFGNLTGISLK